MPQFVLQQLNGIPCRSLFGTLLINDSCNESAFNRFHTSTFREEKKFFALDNLYKWRGKLLNHIVTLLGIALISPRSMFSPSHCLTSSWAEWNILIRLLPVISWNKSNYDDYNLSLYLTLLKSCSQGFQLLDYDFQLFHGILLYSLITQLSCWMKVYVTSV